MVKLIGKISLMLWVLVLFSGCQQGGNEDAPTYDTYPNPIDDTEYVLFEDGILVPYASYMRGIEGGVGEFILCEYECAHTPSYITEVCYLFGEKAFSEMSSHWVYLWIESKVKEVKLHSNRMGGGEFVGLDNNGYYWTNITDYRYTKFPQRNETCFWIQIEPSVFERFDFFDFQIKVYDKDSGIYYESQMYQLQFVGDREFIINTKH